MAKKGVFSKGVVIGIIVLFIGIAVQPSIATIPIDDEIDDDAKEYLFQTIIDIANNPDVKDFIKQNSHNMFTFDYDFKGLNSKLLAKNPRLFTRLLFTKPSISHGYLDKIYNIGIEMIDILGEEQVYELRDSIIVANTEFYDGLSNIVLNDEELSKRIDTLSEINSKYIIIEIICLILEGILMALGVPIYILLTIFVNFSEHPFISLLSIIPLVMIYSIFMPLFLIYVSLGCMFP